MATNNKLKGTISITDVAKELGHGQDFIFDIDHLERALEEQFKTALPDISIGDCLFLRGYKDKRAGEEFDLLFEAKAKTWYCDEDFDFTIFVYLFECD